MSRQSALLAIVVACVVLAASAARGEDIALAREHFKKGTTAYDLGRYAEAATEYEKAYEIRNEPTLLFNIGQAYRGAAEYIKAITAYRSYLRNVPNAPNRVEVEARIAEMQHQILEQKRTTENPPRGTLPSETLKNATPIALPTQPTPPPISNPTSVPSSSGRTEKIAGLALGGAGIVLIGLGGGFVALAKSANDDVTSSGTFDSSAQDRRNAFQSADIACFAIGGAALAGGVALYFVGRSRSRGIEMKPSLGARSAAIEFRISF